MQHWTLHATFNRRHNPRLLIKNTNTMPSEEQEIHNRQESWAAIAKINERVSGIESTVAGQSAQLSAISQTLQRIEARENKPTNLLGLGMFALALMAAMGSFVLLHTAPIAKDVNDEKERFEKFIALYLDDRGQYAQDKAEDHKMRGILEAKVEALEEVDDRLVTEVLAVIKSTSKMEGKQEMHLHWTDKVDNMGSRRWVGESNAK